MGLTMKNNEFAKNRARNMPRPSPYRNKDILAGVLLVVFSVAILAFSLGMVALAIYIMVINWNDIQIKGANFWNVFWLIVAAAYVLASFFNFFTRKS